MISRKRQQKMKSLIRLSSIPIPTYIFLDRTLSVLETLTEFLHEEKDLSYHEIAVLLNRDDRTIWTCYHRALEKRKAETEK